MTNITHMTYQIINFDTDLIIVLILLIISIRVADEMNSYHAYLCALSIELLV